MTKPARYMLLALILLFASCMVLSYAQAQELPADPAGPVVIPTPTMLPAPTPDGFVILWHSVYLPAVTNGR